MSWREVDWRELFNDPIARLAAAGSAAVLWWALALADVRLLVGIPLVAFGARVAMRRRGPLPPESDDDLF
jgi:hypothetical protein